MKTGKLWKLLQFLTSLALFAGLALSPTQPAHAATYTVTSLADTNDGTCNATNCTLREAINAANASLYTTDSIQFTVSGTITITSQLPNIVANNGELTIDGGDQNIKISGNDTRRVFYLAGSTAELVLRNLTIKDGYSGVGGAIYSKGHLEIVDSSLLQNRADEHGGAIYSEGPLTIFDSDISSNSVDLGYGGAIYVYTNTTSTITGTSFIYNYANGHGGAIYNAGILETEDTNFVLNSAGGGNGGAIFNTGTFVAKNTLLSFNSTPLYGGAFYNDKGAQFQFSRSKFLYNSAGRDGGGAYIDTAYPSSMFESCEFTGNTAGSDGGGLTNYLGDFGIYSTIFKSNDASQNGGALYNLYGDIHLAGSTLKSNTADQDGGGIYNLNSIYITRSTFTGNHAVRNGGAVYHGTDAILSDIDNSTFYDNDAARGGGMYSLAALEVTNCTLSANHAATSGGAVFGNVNTIFRNSILANSSSGGNCDNEGTRPANTGNNIDSGTSCGWGSNNGSMSSTNPLLGPLQNNGGTTDTLAILAGSPAIDAVIWNTPNLCPDDDQRKYERPFGLRCDIGAFERYYRLFLPEVMKN